MQSKILILPQVIKNPDPGDPICRLRGDHQPPASEGGGVRELRGGEKVKLAKQKFHRKLSSDGELAKIDL